MDEAAIRGRTARTIGHSQGVSKITVLSQSANDQAPAPSRYVVASWKGCTARLDVRTDDAPATGSCLFDYHYLLAPRSGKCQLRLTLSYNIGFRFGFKLDFGQAQFPLDGTSRYICTFSAALWS